MVEGGRLCPAPPDRLRNRAIAVVRVDVSRQNCVTAGGGQERHSNSKRDLMAGPTGRFVHRPTSAPRPAQISV